MTDNQLNPNAYTLTDEQKNNLALLKEKTTAIEALTDKSFKVTSGFRLLRDQIRIDEKAGRKPTLGSAHMKGAACDIEDLDGSLKRWCMDNQSTLRCLGLYCEMFSFTPGWVHFQVIPPKSGHTFFIPYAPKA